MHGSERSERTETSNRFESHYFALFVGLLDLVLDIVPIGGHFIFIAVRDGVHLERPCLVGRVTKVASGGFESLLWI